MVVNMDTTNGSRLMRTQPPMDIRQDTKTMRSACPKGEVIR